MTIEALGRRLARAEAERDGIAAKALERIAALEAERDRLRAAARRLIAHDEAADRREGVENCQELCELRDCLAEKDGGK